MQIFISGIDAEPTHALPKTIALHVAITWWPAYHVSFKQLKKVGISVIQRVAGATMQGAKEPRTWVREELSCESLLQTVELRRTSWNQKSAVASCNRVP